MYIDYPESLNPYSILGVTRNSSHKECKLSFLRQVILPDRISRCKANLAYDMLTNKEKYKIEGDIYTIKKKDIFYYVVIGDYYSLKHEIENNKNLLYQKDSLKRSLLYLAARNGFYNICEFLIKKGININDIQKDGSTPLHGASFYGQDLIVKLLIDYGANISIKNNFGNLASDEANNNQIKSTILNSKIDKISKLFQKLYSQGIVSNLVLIKKKNKIIAKKLIISQSKLPHNFSQLKKNWVPIWHGTKYQYLESIAKNGLKPSGSKLEDGTMIKPPKGHIALDREIEGIKNWAAAIFVSPSILYSAHVVYSERIMSENTNWACLVQGIVKPSSYTSHTSTIFKYVKCEGEPDNVEYRVECPEDEELIFRVSKNNQNIYVTSIVFVSVNFLDNIHEYIEGNILINSKEERELLN